MSITNSDEIWDIVDDDFYAIYVKLSEHKALNTAIRQMIDNVIDRNTDDKVRDIVNDTISLLNIQENLLSAPEKAADAVSNRLTDIAARSDREENPQHPTE